MSEDGSEKEEEVKEIPELPGKKIFISNINSYTGRALLTELDNKEKCRDPEFAGHKFVGTIQQSTNTIYLPQPGVPDGCTKVVEMSRSREFRDHILESDIIIYDLMTNKFEEVDYVIKTLKTAKLAQQKTLIILSSVMTWVNTPAKLEKEGGDGGEEVPEEVEEPEQDDDDEPEEEAEGEPELDEDGNELPKPPKVLFFKESDNHLRVPHEQFTSHKNLETLALSAPKAQPFLKVHILCCGIRYGLGEAIFFEHFKHAWIQKPNKLPIIGKGDNFIPTIHITDLARVTRRICNENITKEYIFAIDRTKKPTQKRITQAISSGVGTGQVQNFEPKQIASSIVWKDFLNINLKMKTSDVFRDNEAPEEAELDEAQQEALKFPWHSKGGIIENANKLNVEFNERRHLNPVKIFVTGPPASGKTFYADKVQSYYNLPRIHVKQLSEKALKMANVGEEEEQDELGAAIKAKIDELKDAEVERIGQENEAAGIEDPPEVDRDSLTIRVPDEFLYTLLRLRLQENDCRNRGYILDGFPRTYKDCQNIFLKRIPQYDPETGDLIEVDDPDLDEGEEKSWDGYAIDGTIAPTSCVVLKSKDGYLVDRVKNLSENIVAGTHYTLADTKRRLLAYRTANESDIADPSVHDFFKENAIQLFPKDCSLDSVNVLNSLKIYIERMETPNNFMFHDESVEAKRRIMVSLQKTNNSALAQLLNVMEEGVESQLKAQKNKHIQQKMQQLREAQKEDLDQKSQPIRQYLGDNLVPILTDGLIEVCKMQPDDPVDALAEYLFKRSLDVPYPDPCSYIE